MVRWKMTLRILLLILGFVGISSCTTGLPTTTPVVMASSLGSITSVQTSTEVRVLPPTPSLIPTISSIQQNKLIQQLRSTSCTLPCYLGIVPGQTRWSDAMLALENIGASYIGDIQYTDLVSHYYVLTMCCEAANLLHSISIRVDDNNVVQSIDASVELGFGYKVPEYWSNYSMMNIFIQKGLPDKIVINIDHLASEAVADFVFLYEKLGTAVEISVFNEGGNNCFNVGNANGLKLTLINPSSGLNLWRGGIPLSNNTYWKPITDIFGVDEVEFYNRVISDPSTCFEF